MDISKWGENDQHKSKKQRNHSILKTLFLVPPKVEMKEKTVDVLVKNSCELQAMYSGIPQPDIQWLKDQKQIEENQNIKCETNDSLSKLTFLQIEPEHAGTYRCIAKNMAGEAEEKTTVNIFGNQMHIFTTCCPLTFIFMEPIGKQKYQSLKMGFRRFILDILTFFLHIFFSAEPPTISKKLTDLTVIEGEKATFEAEITGIPSPNIDWYKDEESLKDTANFKSGRKDSFANLSFAKTNRTDAGMYKVKVSNSFGSAEAEARLNINGMFYWSEIHILYFS